MQEGRADLQAAHSNEFIRFWQQGDRDVQSLIYKYPIITVVSMIAFTIFGFMQLCSFSVACIPAGMLFIAAAYGLGRTVAYDYKEFFSKLFFSILEVLYLDRLLLGRTVELQEKAVR